MAYNYIRGGFRKQDVITYKLTPYETELLKFLDYKENSLSHDEDPITLDNKLYYKYNYAQLERDICLFKDQQAYIKIVYNLIKKGFIERADIKIWRTQLYLRLTDKYFTIKPKKLLSK